MKHEERLELAKQFRASIKNLKEDVKKAKADIVKSKK